MFITAWSLSEVEGGSCNALLALTPLSEPKGETLRGALYLDNRVTKYKRN